jgi:hypothetical protein
MAAGACTLSNLLAEEENILIRQELLKSEGFIEKVIGLINERGLIRRELI